VSMGRQSSQPWPPIRMTRVRSGGLPAGLRRPYGCYDSVVFVMCTGSSLEKCKTEEDD